VNSESGVVEQTVVVNVVTGEPVSPETILLGVTVSEDGSLSYDVQANASAGVTVGRDALVINVGEDGSYDVFVNGTPGKTISRDSIILGTNTEDGSYTVTANGAAGQILNKQDLVLSLNKDGEWDIVANAKPGVQVTAP
jgi:predicted  nucleic acid-binding Zn-ribbon protein